MLTLAYFSMNDYSNPCKRVLATTENSIVMIKEPEIKEPVKKKRGRPRKSDIQSVKKGNRGVVGRPKGDAAIINEYKARMLASPKSAKVLEKIFDAALDDEHKHQAAAWKIITDRVIPTATFEKDVIKGAGKNAIQINISGIGSVDVSPNDTDNVIDGEVIED